MSVVEVLEQLGGVATRATLMRLTSRAAVDRALAAGDVVTLARGRYALPVVDDARAAAHRLSGVVSHTSAALLHGLAVHTTPTRPHVTVPRNRKVRDEQVELHWQTLDRSEHDGVATTPDRTLVDCLRSLPFAEGLAVADSALRAGFGPQRLRDLTDAMGGAGAGTARRVATAASPLAANPFESALRAAAMTVPGLSVRPQVVIRDDDGFVRVDLADENLRIVLEADSFTWHGSRAALQRDCRRYNALVVRGWLVLRFSWEDVFLHPHQVRATLEAAVVERAELRKRRSRAG